MEVDIDQDLNAVNDQLTQMVEELNKVNAQREQLIQQVQNLNGIAMYLRGKLPPEEEEESTEVEQTGQFIPDESTTVVEAHDKDSVSRSNEYPNT